MKTLEFILRTTVTDYYRVLGVAPAATPAQIRAAYYQLARQHHPDVGGDAVVMARVTEAYAVLGNVERRKQYNAKRRWLCKPCGTCKGAGVTYKQQGFTRRTAVQCRVCAGSGVQGGMKP